MRIAPSRAAIGVGLVAIVVTASACSSSGSGSSSTPPAGSTPAGSTAAQDTGAPVSASTGTTDYSKLLIAASDIPISGFTEGSPATPPNGSGTTVAFTGAGNRTIGDTIIVLPSAEAATAAATASITAAKQEITSPEVTTAPIGDGGTAIRGTASSQEVAILVWHSGRAVVVLEFQSPSGDLVPTDVIQAVATKQQALVKAGVPA